MATTTWFAADESCFRGYVREDHVVVRMWSDERGATLRRATCLPSSGRAESWLQRLLAGETGRRLLRHQGPAEPAWSAQGVVGEVLAEEVAAAIDRTQPWRDWADWLWRRHDARGTRIELGEALSAAIGTARETVLRAQITELEHAHGWAAQRVELEQASAAAQRPGEARPQLRLEHGQLIGFTGAAVFRREFGSCLAALAELRTCIHDRPSFEQLAQALVSGYVRGLASLTIDLERPLTPDQGAALIDAVHRGLPRLRTLAIRSRGARAGLVVGEPLVLALERLLTRQREPKHGIALTELELDLDVPADAWPAVTVDDLCAALGRSALARLRLSAQHWPKSLTRWMHSTGFAGRLTECRLIERRVDHQPASPITPVLVAAPKLANPDDRASLAVWADWLSSHGDPLGELALLLASDRPDPAIRERIATLHGELTSRLAAGQPEALLLRWNGPLIERAEVFGDRCPWPIELVERVLASPAAAALAQLRLTGLDAAATKQALGRLTAKLGTLTRLELDGRVAIATVLDSFPDLQELQIGEPDPSALPNRPYPNLRELGVILPCEWGTREISRLFARLQPELLTGLTRLTLTVEPGRRGPPIPFTRLELARGASVRVVGKLRDCDFDGLRRWSRSNPAHRVELD